MFKDVPKNLNRIFFSLKKALVWQGHWSTNFEIGRNGQWVKALTKKWMMTTYFSPTILLLQKIGIKRQFLEKQSQIAIFLKRCFHFIVRVLAQKRSRKIVLAGSGCHFYFPVFAQFFFAPFSAKLHIILLLIDIGMVWQISRGFCFHSDS